MQYAKSVRLFESPVCAGGAMTGFWVSHQAAVSMSHGGFYLCRDFEMSKVSSGDSKNTLYCSFCGKSQHEVRKLIAGPSWVERTFRQFHSTRLKPPESR
jgi:ClpX C4-type zinc finger